MKLLGSSYTGIQKPPLGVQLNRSHPLATGIRVSVLFNELSGEPRDQINNIASTFVGTPDWVSGGIQCIGEEVIRFPAGQYYTFGNRGSLFCQVTLNDIYNNHRYPFYHNAWAANTRLEIRADANETEYRLWLAETDNIDTNIPIPFGTKHDICLTWDSGTWELYFNGGEQYATGSYTGSIQCQSGEEVDLLGYATFTPGTDVMYVFYQWDTVQSNANVEQLHQNPYCIFERTYPIDVKTYQPRIWQVPAITPGQKPPLGSQLNKSHPLAVDMVGGWLLNETSGDRVNDLSGMAGGVGTLSGVTWQVGDKGIACECGNYASSDRITLPNNDTCKMVFPNGTMVTKVHLRTIGNSEYHYFWSVRDIGGPTSIWYIYNSDWSMQLDLFCNGNSHLSGEGVAIDNAWVTYAVTWDNDLVIYYIDGVEVASVAANGDYPKSDPTLANLLNRDDGGRCLDGWMEYFYAYKRTLTALQIEQIHRDPYCMFRNPVMGAVEIPTPRIGMWKTG